MVPGVTPGDSQIPVLSRFRFKSFRTRLMVFFAGLLVLVQLAAFILVNAANIRNATDQISSDLEVGARVFRRIIDERTFGLLVSARSLSGDFAFKRTIADGDHATILSVMDNHLGRIEADAMMLVSLHGTLIADTLHPQARNSAVPWRQLMRAAESDEYGEAAGILLIDGQLYQMTVVPLLSPDPVAWILIGFAIDNGFASDISKISEVSILHRVGEVGITDWHNAASTLEPALQGKLPSVLADIPWQEGVSTTLHVHGTDFVSLVTYLERDEENQIIAVLQRSLAAQLAPYQQLQGYLIALFAVGLALSVIAALILARSVTRPVLTLSDGVKRIADGDYSQRVNLAHKDELGLLASSFNSMAVDLEEKEKVRNLLGKVVSPAIAEELLSKDIELGGEERVVSVLFADVRNFTALSEGRSPRALLSLLNQYLTQISEVVEQHGGVVDKYIGDAVMALFGAPLQRDNDAARAVNAALDMVVALGKLNIQFREKKMAELAIGVGINTASVVVGNMGSLSRMNYTVIGDGVNLASRLESLTRQYGAQIIVSDATRQAAPDYCYRILDRVRVKGKQQAVTIHEPLGPRAVMSESLQKELDYYHRALGYYQRGDWLNAQLIFDELATRYPGTQLYKIYRQRCGQYIQAPPEDSWDGVFTFTEK